MYSTILFAAAVVPLASALSVNTPSGWTSGGQETVTWSTSSGDPSVFTIELAFPSFNQAFGLANNVNASRGTVTVDLPQVSNNSANYQLQFVNVTNDAQVFGSSSTFAIAPQVSSTSSGSSTSGGTSTGTGTSSGTSSTGTATSGSSSSTATSPTSSGSSSTSASSTSSSTSATSAASSIRTAISMNPIVAMVSLAAVALTAGVAL